MKMNKKSTLKSVKNNYLTHQKTTKGITLIALVITIIVLLILAGVSISILSGDNGILQRTTDAKEKSELAQTQERIKLAYNSALIEDLTGGSGNVKKQTFEAELAKEFPRSTISVDVDSNDSANWIVTVDEVSFPITAGLITAGESNPAKTLTITSTNSHGQYVHLSQYFKNGEQFTLSSLPENTTVNFEITIKNASTTPTYAATGGIYSVDQINNLSAGYTAVCSDTLGVPTVTNNSDGSVTVGFSNISLRANALSNNRPYILFPILVNDVAVGDVFTLVDAHVEINGVKYYPDSIGGAFTTERINEEIQINSFQGLTASFYGDSLTEVNYHYTKGYHSWIKDLVGLSSYNNYGLSGRTISGLYDTVNSINDTADVLFIMIGVNDSTFLTPIGQMGDTTEGTVYGEYYRLMNLLKTKYPSKKIVIITPHLQKKYATSKTAEENIEYMRQIGEACRQTSRHFDLACYDNQILSGFVLSNLDTYTTDGCHWNNAGHELVGKNISKWLLSSYRNNATTTKVKTVTINSIRAGGVHISQYFTDGGKFTLASLPENTSVNFEFTYKNASNNPTASATGGIFTVNQINNLNAGYTAICSDVLGKPTVTNNSDASVTVRFSNIRLNANALSNNRPYILFPILLTNVAVGDVFTLVDAHVEINGVTYYPDSIGGAFTEESITITETDA